MLSVITSEPGTVLPAETTMLDDLATLINAVYQQNIEPTQAGYVPKRIANKLRGQPKGRSYISYDGIDQHFEMLFRLMQSMELIQLSEVPLLDMKERYEPGSQLARWAKMDAVRQTKLLLEQWTTNRYWHDMAGVNYNPTGWHYIDPREGRKTLMKHLCDCTIEEWYSVASLLEKIWSEDHLMLRADRKQMRKLDQKALKDDKERWMQLDGEIYIGMLASSLYELGMVEIGYEEAGIDPEETPVNPHAFRLTMLGARALITEDKEEQERREKRKEEPARRLLIVQPNFELLLLEPDLPTLYSVLPFTIVKQIGMVSHLVLTQGSLLRGLSAGKTVEQVISTLEEHSQKELPQNVLYSLRDWSKQHKEVRISQVLLLEVADVELTTYLCNLAKLQQYGIRQLGPTLLAVDGDTSLQSLKTTLDKEQIVVALTGKFAGKYTRYEALHGRR